MAKGVRIELKQGESAESVAYLHGHFVATVWDHPENAALKAERESPHILLPGDVLFVPQIREKRVEAATDRSHRFRRRGVPSRVTVLLRAAGGEVLANLPYRLELAGRSETGTTDGDGKVSVPVMPDVGDARLVVDPDGRNVVVPLGMRRLDPITTVSGVQGRLRNLGLYAGEVDGLYGQLTIRAVQLFQLLHALPTHGSVDEATRARLEAAHGC